MSAAAWSAIAACFSALSAFLMMLIHRRNLLESLRPELVLIDWHEKDIGGAWEIAFHSIRNIGRGAALNVNVRSDFCAIGGSSVVLDILGPNETMNVDGYFTVEGRTVEGRIVAADTFLPHEGRGSWSYFSIEVFCWDYANRKHITRYDLSFRPGMPMFGLADLTRSLSLCNRRTTVKKIWLLKLQGKAITFRSRAKKLWCKLKSQSTSEHHLDTTPTSVAQIAPTPTRSTLSEDEPKVHPATPKPEQ